MISTETLARYLGGPAAALLADPPFSGWSFDRTVDDDLDAPVIDYVCAEGVDVSADAEDRVGTIFVGCGAGDAFAQGLGDLAASWGRAEVLAGFGAPSKSGQETDNVIFGPSGAWDRFARDGYAVHVQYRIGGGEIVRITLMRADLVP
ncbi:hypothetical protein TPR58_12490 [Sphingomonas sp. HF-S3]|uniref:Uncharacterized protein n=1 Tax=Sphingomonas rustica TaxID=3103142 RepID=A0ABV0BBN4_9SPHN